MEEESFNRLENSEFTRKEPYVVQHDYLPSGEVIYIYSDGTSRNADGVIVSGREQK